MDADDHKGRSLWRIEKMVLENFTFFAQNTYTFIKRTKNGLRPNRSEAISNPDKR